MRPRFNVCSLRFAKVALAALLKHRDSALLLINLRFEARNLRPVLLQFVVDTLNHGSRLIDGRADGRQLVANPLLTLGLLAQHVDVRLTVALGVCNGHDGGDEQRGHSYKLVEIDRNVHVVSTTAFCYLNRVACARLANLENLTRVDYVRVADAVNLCQLLVRRAVLRSNARQRVTGLHCVRLVRGAVHNALYRAIT